MQTVVYADILIFLNTVISFIILLTTADFVKIESEKIRYITGSLTGGIFSLIIIAPQMNIFLTVISRFLICVLIVLISFNVRNIRILLKCISGFILITFLYSSFFYFIFSFTKHENLYFNNGYFYFDFSAISAIIITAVIFIILRIINKLLINKKKDELIFDVDIFVDDAIIKVKAFYDTGNSIKDNFTERPVILISVCEISDRLDESLVESVKSVLNNKNFSYLHHKLRLIPVKTLGEFNMLPAFSADKAIISDISTRKIVEKPCIAICTDIFSGKKYNALINNEVLGRGINLE